MAAAAAAQLAFAQCLFDSCIASFDADKQRRPYHRNCGCALHGCGQAGTRVVGVSCRCANLPSPLRLGTCSRGRLLAVAISPAAGRKYSPEGLGGGLASASEEPWASGTWDEGGASSPRPQMAS